MTLYASSWWQEQVKVTYRNTGGETIPPFGVAALYTRDGEYLGSSWPDYEDDGERLSSTGGDLFTRSQGGFLFNGPTPTRSGKLGLGTLSLPAIARVNKDLDLRDGYGLTYGNADFTLDVGTKLECLGVFQDPPKGATLALVGMRRKTTSVGPSITLLFDPRPSQEDPHILPLSEYAVKHEQYSDTVVGDTDINDGQFIIEADESLSIPLDGIYSFSFSQAGFFVSGFPSLVFPESRWPPPNFPFTFDAFGTDVQQFRFHTPNAGSVSVVLPCFGGMTAQIWMAHYEFLGMSFCASRIAPLPLGWSPIHRIFT